MCWCNLRTLYFMLKENRLVLVKYIDTQYNIIKRSLNEIGIQ